MNNIEQSREKERKKEEKQAITVDMCETKNSKTKRRGINSLVKR
jgi:hypothetical protein